LISKSIISFICAIALVTSCTNFHPASEKSNTKYVSYDLDSIVKRGRLIAVTDFNSRNYYIYKGEPMGFNYELLKSFSDHLGIDLEIIPENNLLNSFELLRTGKADLLAIDFKVCHENKDLMNTVYYPGIEISTPVSYPQNFAWGLRKNNSEALLNELNRWIRSYKNTGSYARLYTKYYKSSHSGIVVKSDYYTHNNGKVSRYDDMIKKYSVRIDWDWRLLASLICQESHFNPEVESWAGAYGLMQVMPVTGRNFGIDITASTENNMKAGILYINWLHSIFDPKIPDEKERINFILAAYNAGPGHVLDAMKLAEKHGMDPRKWNGNVAVWLQKKSEPRYYNDTVVKNGYFKGKESVAFVSEVLDRYKHYKNFIPEEKNNPF
jgi:membrane-bound lytic murein transglycosylase F